MKAPLATHQAPMATTLLWRTLALTALILGVIGAFVGGWIGSLLGLGSVDEFFSIGTWLLAIGGSILVILVWGLITKKR